ncbi:single-stranded-DNA-specific exonuclease RecJ [Sulfobacillus harzensis]|uniref:Single-stranded-DNA-specific exonuclease RecJ n=1 Tax=Sulfobacillus harzensis TaxID=2729629 RepID=A0A7Y0L3A5_9FIRM|nr:single-stranded-DNA-specific exonuclease RecJ [Sulfobacillus harzensis]NMP22508.1 single-stranded-DNA-specific exonuclease RecJ [Sulfobacillus harzensis]
MKNQLFFQRPVDRRTVEEAQRTWGVPGWQAEFLLRRGFQANQPLEDLDGSLALPDPKALPGMREAVWTIRRVLEDGGRVRVYGDYDADGVTATAVLVRGLTLLGFGKQVDWYIPNRFDEGYGLNVEAVWRAHQDGVTLLVTVDCGSSSPEAADLARSLGLMLVITDHHALPERIPEADALVNPELMTVPDRFSGAGVALQLVRALFAGEELPEMLYGIATVGTVADVVPLKGSNRRLVARGLEALRQGAVAGLNVLFGAEGRDIAHASAEDLAFLVGPRINAAGRMGGAEAACELLLEDDLRRLQDVSDTLKELNAERREVERLIVEEAWTRLPRDASGRIYDFPVICGDGWHQGVIGIVAARFRAWLRQPVAVVAWNGSDGKGSARSVDGFNLIAHLRQHGALFSKLGGHAGAAGFSLPRTDADRLSRELSRDMPSSAAFEQYRGFEYDVALDATDVSATLWDEVESLAPYGKAFEAPRFLIRGTVKKSRVLGQGQHGSFELEHHPVRAIAFGQGEQVKALYPGAAVRFLAQLETHWYQGKRSPQWRVEVLQGEAPKLSAAVQEGLPDPLPSRVIWVVDSDRDVREWALKLQAHAFSVTLPIGELMALEEEARRGLVSQLVVSQWRPWPRLYGWADAVIWRCHPRNRAKWEEAAYLAKSPDGCWFERPEGGRVDRKRARLAVSRARLGKHWRAWQSGRAGLIPGRAVFEELEMSPDGLKSGERRRLDSSFLYRLAVQDMDEDARAPFFR